MLSMSVTTKLKAEEVLKRAEAFFGPKGLALDITEQTDTGIYFHGGGGSVEVSMQVNGDRTSVSIASVEWDYQAREFIAKLI